MLSKDAPVNFHNAKSGPATKSGLYPGATKTSLSASARTKRRIQRAFAELLSEKGRLGRITVTELAERAEVTRGTFYNYYDNIFEVANDLQRELEVTLFSEGEFKTVAEIDSYLDRVFAFLAEHRELYSGALRSEAVPEFLKRLGADVNRRVLEVVRKMGLDKSGNISMGSKRPGGSNDSSKHSGSSNDPSRRSRNSTNASQHSQIEIDVLFLANGTIALVQKSLLGEIDLSLDQIRDYLKNKVHEVLD